MSRKGHPEDRARARLRIVTLYDELGVQDEQKRKRLNHVITGHQNIEQMTEADLLLLIEVLAELTSRPREEREVTLELLLAPEDPEKGSSG